ncbi:hypothetical protein SeLEV6574_g05941 [Synchytrium endobioticum]|nr:hypothetical protein SeLEV6574_g05941 [Synchytrium endobioticum]
MYGYPETMIHPDEATSVATRLKTFIRTAPDRLRSKPSPCVDKFELDYNGPIAVVSWNQGIFVSGTDVLKIVQKLFSELGRPIDPAHQKKWEEGIFSDLRGLKVSVGCILEQPRSPLLQYLFTHGAIRTQKKQKVFKLEAVNFDKLFIDALRRDLRRIESGQAPTTKSTNESSAEALKRAHELLGISGTPDDFEGHSRYTPRPVSASPSTRTTKNKRKKYEDSDDESEHESGWDAASEGSDEEEELDCIVEGCTKTFTKPQDLRKHVRRHENDTVSIKSEFRTPSSTSSLSSTSSASTSTSTSTSTSASRAPSTSPATPLAPASTSFDTNDMFTFAVPALPAHYSQSVSHHLQAAPHQQEIVSPTNFTAAYPTFNQFDPFYASATNGYLPPTFNPFMLASSSDITLSPEYGFRRPSLDFMNFLRRRSSIHVSPTGAGMAPPLFEEDPWHELIVGGDFIISQGKRTSNDFLLRRRSSMMIAAAGGTQ